MKRYVIVGGGPAGINAAVTIRSKDPDGSLLVLDRDRDRPYYRTELDTYIGGSTPEADMPLYPDSFYQEQRIQVRSQTVVSRLRLADRALDLSDGATVDYDALLLAPGSRPLAGSWPGAELRGVMTVRTWEDAREVVTRVAETDRMVVVVGGGVLGLILAEGIHQRGKQVVLLERERVLWTPFLDKDASGLVLKKMHDVGVEVLLGQEVAESYGENGQVTGIRTSGGQRVETALVVVAIGVRPDIGFLEGSGVRTDRGILIDHEFRTNVQDVFAAGDAAQGYDPVSGFFRLVTNWNNAAEQGRLAGASMAGATAPYRGVLVSNSESFFGLRVSIMGLAQPTGKNTVIVTGRDEAKGLYRRLLIREDRLLGAILAGNVSGEGMMKKIILDGKSLTVADAKSKFLTGLVIEESVAS